MKQRIMNIIRASLCCLVLSSCTVQVQAIWGDGFVQGVERLADRAAKFSRDYVKPLADFAADEIIRPSVRFVGDQANKFADYVEEQRQQRLAAAKAESERLARREEELNEKSQEYSEKIVRLEAEMNAITSSISPGGEMAEAQRVRFRACENSLRAAQEDKRRVQDELSDNARLKREHEARVAQQEREFEQLKLNGMNQALNIGGSFADALAAQFKAGAQARIETAKEQAKGDAVTERYLKMAQHFSDPSNLKGPVAAIGLSAFLVFGAYYGLDVFFRWIEKHLGTPKLIKETNIPNFWQWLFAIELTKKSRLHEFVTPPGIDEQISTLTKTTANKVQHGRLLSNVLFIGPPGTGKTMFARELARRIGEILRESGLKGGFFDITSGDRWTQFSSPGQAIHALHAYIDNREAVAEYYGMPIIIFVDEGDSIFSDRRLPGTSELSRKLVNAWLARVDAPSSKLIMWIIASNNPERLDSAVWSRIGSQIIFRVPNVEGIQRLLRIYLKKHVLDYGIMLDDEQGFEDEVSVDALEPEEDEILDDEAEEELDPLAAYIIEQAPKLQGFSARSIEQVMVEMQTAVDEEGSNFLTKEMVDRVIARKVEEYNLGIELEKQKEDQFGVTALVGTDK